MIWIYVFLGLAGVLNTVQSGSNSTLQKVSHHPILPAFVSFAVGLLCLGIAWLGYAAYTRSPMPSASDLARAPWWAWIGGLLGCVYVLAMVNVSSKVGAAVFTGITVTVGIVTSVVMDHFGLLGFEQHKASPWRLLGVVLMLGGIALVSRF
ncbi:DMT family transporter [Granulicella cerasi]|uniref:DMT family transporter n=1 Tax=Granulicella cerasi TaxID=741063 RepID=A0ABW1ZEA0_9BACT|nr:DMT family transporter [Granulicella cerasi]